MEINALRSVYVLLKFFPVSLSIISLFNLLRRWYNSYIERDTHYRQWSLNSVIIITLGEGGHGMNGEKQTYLPFETFLSQFVYPLTLYFPCSDVAT